jgi:hypothetical protein
VFVCAANYCKVHSTKGCSPAVALKLATETWTIETLIDEASKEAILAHTTGILSDTKM